MYCTTLPRQELVKFALADDVEKVIDLKKKSKRSSRESAIFDPALPRWGTYPRGYERCRQLMGQRERERRERTFQIARACEATIFGSFQFIPPCCPPCSAVAWLPHSHGARYVRPEQQSVRDASKVRRYRGILPMIAGPCWLARQFPAGSGRRSPSRAILQRISPGGACRWILVSSMQS